ncbi:MAG: D-serine ammonia-lyase [Victivallales bacterium]|nr:D-serine ammonia-lyase [Victivallales bacterium]
MEIFEKNLRERRPFLWLNHNWRPAETALSSLPLSGNDISYAENRLERFAGILETLFPELRESRGIIESELLPAPKLAKRLGVPSNSGALFIKADHALPVAGSIKARGGIYAVLYYAEKLAIEEGVLSDENADHLKLLGKPARAIFAERTLSVASTGNLGLSIGVMGAALGFKVTIHMSEEAKEWKKERLRNRGVEVVEHESDYIAAGKAAREQAYGDPLLEFIDDENSRELFLGYAVAISRLKRQFNEAGIQISPNAPLFIYLPCGVDGAPGGITFAARIQFGDDAHCFFAEPVNAPCMTLGLATGKHSDTTIYDYGIELQTDADGLAVSRPSQFVGEMMEPLLSGCYTLTDETMYKHLLSMYESEGIEVEPSAATGCEGPEMLLNTDEGRRYLTEHSLTNKMRNAIHVVWTTGGLFVPKEQHVEFRGVKK